MEPDAVDKAQGMFGTDRRISIGASAIGMISRIRDGRKVDLENLRHYNIGGSVRVETAGEPRAVTG